MRTLWFLLVLLLLSGCDGGGSPELIQVVDVGPRELETGERVAVFGSGFPQGRAAKVTFRGTLFRAGETPQRGVELGTDAVVRSPELAELTLSDRLFSSFCGSAPDARHTTFSGEVEVTFRSAIAGAPPVHGVSGPIVLDFVPPRPSLRALAGATEEASRILAALGLRHDPAGNPGVVIAAVDPGSRAAAAGLFQGDRITRFAGVRVQRLEDIALTPDAVSAEVGFERAPRLTEQTTEVSIHGLHRTSTSLFFSIVLVLASVVFAWGVTMRLPPLGTWVEHRLFEKTFREPWQWPRHLGTSPLAALFFFVIFLLPLLHPLAGFSLDLSLAFSMLLFGGLVSRWWALLGKPRAFSEAVRALALAVCLLLVFITPLAALGAMQLEEVARPSGGTPWIAMENPVSLALAILAVALVTLWTRDNSSEHPLMVVEDVHLGAALSLVFFGGFQLPFLGGDQGLFARMGSGLFLAAKTALVVLLLSKVRTSFPRSLFSVSGRTLCGRILPVAGVLCAGHYVLLTEPVTPLVRQAMRLASFALVFALVAAWGVRALSLRPVKDFGRMNPFV